MAVPVCATDVAYSGQAVTITQPGTYVLTDDITNSNQMICIEIRASDVVFDGAGHLIDGVDGMSSAGIYVHGPSSTVQNVTIRNVRVQDWYYGVYLHEVDNSCIESSTLSSNPFAGAVVYRGATGNTVTGCTVTDSNNGIVLSDGATDCVVSDNQVLQNGRGLYVYVSDGITLTGNTIASNSDCGIELHASGGGTIYNNRLDNNLNVNVAFTGEPLPANAWSVVPRSGPNILGGPSIGGNYWAEPDGLGLSQITADGDDDGFVDATCEIAPQNVDDHPLAPAVGFVPTPFTTPPTADPTPAPSLTTTPIPTVPTTPPVTLTPTPTTPGTPTEVTYSGQKITITQPGTYVLKNDITDSGQPICIEIQASNVVFDGAGHLIDGIDAENSIGIYVNGPSGAPSGVTIRNVLVQDWCYGIYLLDADYSHIESSTLSSNVFCGAVVYKYAIGNSFMGNTITGNGDGIVFSSGATNAVVSDNQIDRNNGGLYIFISDGITITRNNILNNTDSGIQVHISDGGSIYNNRLNNNLNVAFTGEPISANTWSVAPGAAWVPGNIVGGPQVGGNYWGNPNGNGFSQTNPDTDHDGFIDTAFQIAEQNVDYHPLAVYTILPVCTGCYTPHPTGIPTTIIPTTGIDTPAPMTTTTTPPSTSTTTTPMYTTQATVTYPTAAATLTTTTVPSSPGDGNIAFSLEQTRPARVGETGAVTLYMNNPYQSMVIDVWLEISWDSAVIGYNGTDWRIDGLNMTETAGTDELVLKFSDATNGYTGGRTAIAEINFDVLDTGVSPLDVRIIQGQSHLGPGQAGLLDWTSLATANAGTFRPITVVPGGAGYPTDPDGDGIYEDINGNGRPDFADVVLLFNQLTWLADHAPVPVFDYNTNGRIDFGDVVALFTAM